MTKKEYIEGLNVWVGDLLKSVKEQLHELEIEEVERKKETAIKLLKKCNIEDLERKTFKSKKFLYNFIMQLILK